MKGTDLDFARQSVIAQIGSFSSELDKNVNEYQKAFAQQDAMVERNRQAYMAQQLPALESAQELSGVVGKFMNQDIPAQLQEDAKLSQAFQESLAYRKDKFKYGQLADKEQEGMPPALVQANNAYGQALLAFQTISDLPDSPQKKVLLSQASKTLNRAETVFQEAFTATTGMPESKFYETLDKHFPELNSGKVSGVKKTLDALGGYLTAVPAGKDGQPLGFMDRAKENVVQAHKGIVTSLWSGLQQLGSATYAAGQMTLDSAIGIARSVKKVVADDKQVAKDVTRLQDIEAQLVRNPNDPALRKEYNRLTRNVGYSAVELYGPTVLGIGRQIDLLADDPSIPDAEKKATLEPIKDAADEYRSLEAKSYAGKATSADYVRMDELADKMENHIWKVAKEYAPGVASVLETGKKALLSQFGIGEETGKGKELMETLGAEGKTAEVGGMLLDVGVDPATWMAFGAAGKARALEKAGVLLLPQSQATSLGITKKFVEEWVLGITKPEDVMLTPDLPFQTVVAVDNEVSQAADEIVDTARRETSRPAEAPEPVETTTTAGSVPGAEVVVPEGEKVDPQVVEDAKSLAVQEEMSTVGGNQPPVEPAADAAPAATPEPSAEPKAEPPGKDVAQKKVLEDIKNGDFRDPAVRGAAGRIIKRIRENEARTPAEEKLADDLHRKILDFEKQQGTTDTNPVNKMERSADQTAGDGMAEAPPQEAGKVLHFSDFVSINDDGTLVYNADATSAKVFEPTKDGGSAVVTTPPHGRRGYQDLRNDLVKYKEYADKVGFAPEMKEFPFQGDPNVLVKGVDANTFATEMGEVLGIKRIEGESDLSYAQRVSSVYRPLAERKGMEYGTEAYYEGIRDTIATWRALKADLKHSKGTVDEPYVKTLATFFQHDQRDRLGDLQAMIAHVDSVNRDRMYLAGKNTGTGLAAKMEVENPGASSVSSNPRLSQRVRAVSEVAGVDPMAQVFDHSTGRINVFSATKDDINRIAAQVATKEGVTTQEAAGMVLEKMTADQLEAVAKATAEAPNPDNVLVLYRSLGVTAALRDIATKGRISADSRAILKNISFSDTLTGRTVDEAIANGLDESRDTFGAILKMTRDRKKVSDARIASLIADTPPLGRANMADAFVKYVNSPEMIAKRRQWNKTVARLQEIIDACKR